MCKKINYKTSNVRIDKCMIILIKWLKVRHSYYKFVASCCGHGKYPMTIVVKHRSGSFIELFSEQFLDRTRKFYKRDKQKYYYIPETIKNKNV